MSSSWYPDYTVYYVADADPAVWPVRQGDVFPAPAHLGPESDDPWHACQVIHPSCEIGAKTNPKQLQVIRVGSLADFRDANEQATVVQGFSERDGMPRIAFAHTFFLPPVPGGEEPLYADFRQVRVVPRGTLDVGTRLAALTHDARVYFIRRKLYWEQRWFLEAREVFRIEAERIRADGAFVGPKPEWAA